MLDEKSVAGKRKSFQVRIRDKGIKGSLFWPAGVGRRGRGLGARGGGSCREVHYGSENILNMSKYYLNYH